MFTKGQQARMEGALNSPTAYRDQLWTEENLAATGTDGIHDLACAPQSDFYPSEKFTCVNNTVTFHDLSSDAEATSWAWTFQDGIPSTSNAANPSVQFTSPGWKTVTLTVGNSVGSTTMSQNLAILVSPEWSEVNGLLSESCSINPLDSYWIKNNINNNISTWGYTAVTGYNNEQGALFLNEIDLENGLWNSRGDDQDELITPSMDLSLLSNGTFNFKYAYATQAVNLSDITETLEIWSTKNCGETWTLRETISGLDLVTDGVYISQFVPNSNNQWRDFSFAIPASIETEDVRFKFVFNSSDFSNNLYLDEINISGNVGLDEMGQLKPVQLYPNPTRDILSIKLSDNASKALSRIDIRDISGKLIKQLPISGFRNNITVDVQDLSEGVYFIQFLMQNGILNETFVKASN
jgi:PKD repeat protein